MRPGINEDLVTKRYAQGDEKAWEDVCRRVARHAGERSGRINEYYDAIHAGLFFPSRMTYMGTDYPFASSCFVFPVEDSLSGIMKTLSDACQVQKYGGGTGYNFSHLRPKGDLISTSKGEASGPVSFMKLFHNAMEVVHRAGKKHAAQMGILNCDHPDIFEFIRCKDVEGALWTFNISVGIFDGFMEAVEIDAPWDLRFGGRTYRTIQARELWDEIVQHAWGNGDPGVIFLDTINRNNRYPEPVEATNPCWTGDTKVWTAYGPKTFRELAESGEDVPVLTQTQDQELAFRWMRNPRLTRRSARLVAIELDDGSVFRCTPDHNIYLRNGIKVQAKNLMPGDSIVSVYRHNATPKGYQRLTNGYDKPMEHHVAIEWNIGRRPNWPAEHVHHIDGDKKNNRPDNLELMPAHEHNALNMRGEDNPMYGVWDERNPLFGIDVTGENNPRYRQDIDTQEIEALRNQGMSFDKIAKRLGCSAYTVSKRLGYTRPEKVNHKVASVEPLPYTEDVYNGTVDETHCYFVVDRGGNGAILSANCGEQALPPYVSCNLGSIDLSRFVYDDGEIIWDALERATRTGVRFLDDSIASAFWPVEEVAAKTQRYKNIGLGVMGWADMLILLGIPYDSEEAVELADKVMGFIDAVADDESHKLGNGTRKNITVTSIAPTGSISMLAGCSSGIEPVFGIVTTKNTYVGSQTTAHWIFEQIAKERGFYSDALLTDIAQRGGVQGLDAIPAEVQALFKTANEIDWHWHIEHQAAFQAHTDNAVSKTINLANSATVQDVADAYRLAFETSCKSTTVYRDGSRQVQVLDSKTTTRETCPNCNAILFMNDGEMVCVSCGYKPSAAGTATKRPRPDALRGATYRKETPLGRAYVTVNSDEAGEPLEVFLNVGKAGSETSAVSEALGRLISLTLRMPAAIAPAERLRWIVDELAGIGGGRPLGFGNHRVRSLPDGIAQVLTEHMGGEPAPAAPLGDICPDCGEATLLNMEGCRKCAACGYSEC